MLRRSARNSTAKPGLSDQRVESPPDNNSGKAKAKQDILEDPEDVDMLDAANKYEDDKDDDGGKDTGSKRSKGSAKASPKKRAKTAHPTGSTSVKISSATKGKQRRSLSLLLTMPLDVLFEIFCHLSPKDIVNLSRTTKTFRKTLMTRKATTVWKAAREREGAPECPSWMSEPAWAVLLFGFSCQSCGVKGVPKADFLLMKRVCIKCKKRSLIYQHKIIRRYPSIDPEVLDLIPATNIGGWSHGHASTGNFYWDEDVETMISKLSSLKKDFQKNRSNGQKVLDDFRAERKQRIQEIKRKADQRTDWQYIAEDQRYDAIWAAQRKRLEQIKQKFLDLGYEPDDIYHLCYREECNQKAPLTEKIWQRIRPALEEFIQEQKRYRLERKAGAIQYQRRQIVAACYKDYRRTLHPSQWKYVPRVFEILNFDPISRHLDKDPSVEVTASTFEEAFNNLSEFITGASERRKKCLRALLPTEASGIKEETKTSPDPVELATAVFECNEISRHDISPYFLFGWEDISSHHCLPDKEERQYIATVNIEPKRDTPRIVYSPPGAKVVQKLVELAGLDYITATLADMDLKDLTYFCDCCPSFPNAKGSPGQCQFGYNWRAMTIHLTRSEGHNPNFKVTIISDPEAAGMKKNEDNKANWQANQWTCAHCPEYLDSFQNREVVEQHLLENHAIVSPTVPTDLFYFERFKSGFVGRYEYLVSQG